MPNDRVQIRLIGSLPGGETWSINPNFTAVGAGGQVVSLAQAQDWADQIADDLPTALGGTLKQIMSSSVSIDQVRVAYYGTDQQLKVAAEAAPASPVAGTQGLNMPLQTAMVFSLFTGVAGRSYRGRLYWPALSVSLVGGTGRFQQAVCQTAATQAAALLRFLADSAPAAFTTVEPVVFSRVKEVATEVTEVRIGDVPDTQRPRRDSLAEAYLRAAIPA